MELHFSFVEERFKDICCQTEDTNTLLMGEGAGRRQTLSGRGKGGAMCGVNEGGKPSLRDRNLRTEGGQVKAHETNHCAQERQKWG